jgi:hypothetical protein
LPSRSTPALKFSPSTGPVPDTARAMAFLLQQGTAREAHATARELGRLPYAAASFERVAYAVGAHAVARQEVVEQALIEATEVPPEAHSVSVSLDRVSVPIKEPRGGLAAAAAEPPRRVAGGGGGDRGLGPAGGSFVGRAPGA